MKHWKISGVDGDSDWLSWLYLKVTWRRTQRLERRLIEEFHIDRPRIPWQWRLPQVEARYHLEINV